MRRGGALVLASSLFGLPARAELAANGEPIRSHDYAIDLAQTAVLAGTRVTGLSGAFTAIGEGVDGSAQNPAAVALRSPWSTDLVDYDLGLGVTFASALEQSDFFNSGRRTVLSRDGEESLLFLNFAGNLQLGRWGFGISADLRSYSLNRSSDSSQAQAPDRLVATFAVSHSMLGYAFHDSELLIGFGARTIALDVANANAASGDDESLFQALGSGLEAGVLVKPNGARYRIGVGMRSAVTARASATSRTRILYPGDPENELHLPDRVTLPWEVDVGAAVQLGARPMNPRWIEHGKELEPTRRYLEFRARERERARRAVRDDAQRRGLDPVPALRALDAEFGTQSALDALYLDRVEREVARRLRDRYRGMKRFYFLIAGSLDVLGGVEDGVGVESFLERRVQRSGARASLSPRLGVETEAIPSMLRLRAGSYLEPTRFDDNPRGDRLHLTFGLDQRLFEWEVFGLWSEDSTWKFSGAVDVARTYFSWGVAVGMWH